ncbi:hypothetical protein Tco_1527029, partial [Tanacetum coccineum]
NDSIVAEHGLSSKITQSPCGSSNTSEGSKNSGSFEDSGRSNEEDSEDGASSKKGESVQWKKAINEEMVSLQKNQTCSLVRLPAVKKASQSLWMFNVKEEQDVSKRYKAQLVVKGAQKRGFLANWAGRKPRVQIEEKSVRIKASTETMDRCSEKQVLGYVFTVGVTTVEWESRLQKSITMYTKSSIHFAKNLKVYSWAKLVRILISEGSLSLLKILGTKSLAEMFTRLVMKEKLKFCAASTGLQVN